MGSLSRVARPLGVTRHRSASPGAPPEPRLSARLACCGAGCPAHLALGCRAPGPGPTVEHRPWASCFACPCLVLTCPRAGRRWAGVRARSTLCAPRSPPGPLRAVRRLCLPSPSRELTGQAGRGSACRPHWAVAHRPGSEPGARAADAPCWRPGVGHAPMAGVSPEAPRLGVRPPSPRVLTRPAVVVLTPSSCKGTSRTSFHLLHPFEGPIPTRALPEVLGAGVGTRSGHGCHPAGARAPHPHRLNLLCLASDRCLK